MKTTIDKNSIPLLICVILLLASIIAAILSLAILDYTHYLGIVLISLSIVAYFINRKVFNYVFALTLALGIANIIHVSVIKISFTLVFINFNPIFLGLLILFLILNKKELNTLFPEKDASPQNSKKKRLENEQLIIHYEKLFKNKTESELKGIVIESSSYTKEAKEASKNILKKLRQNN